MGRRVVHDRDRQCDMGCQKMKLELYSFSQKGRHVWRWRITDDSSIVVAQGMINHDLREDAQRELDEIIDFLEAWSRERVQYGAVR